jgi:hypothetical protein
MSERPEIWFEWVGFDGWEASAPTSPCRDCGWDTCRGDEVYMVHSAVWAAAGMPYAGYLCVGCLETRLGRTLTARDFKDVPLNRPGVRRHSPRLHDRLTLLRVERESVVTGADPVTEAVARAYVTVLRRRDQRAWVAVPGPAADGAGAPVVD